MRCTKQNILTLVTVCLLILSMACSGFLVGRTVRYQEEGKFERVQEVGEVMIDVGVFVHRGAAAITRIVLR